MQELIEKLSENIRKRIIYMSILVYEYRREGKRLDELSVMDRAAGYVKGLLDCGVITMEERRKILEYIIEGGAKTCGM